MPEEKNDIDNFFRDKLENFETNPPERVWNAIARDLDRKKRARLFWIFGLLFLGAVVSTGSYFYFTDGKQASSPEKISSASENSGSVIPVTDLHQPVKTGTADAQKNSQAGIPQSEQNAPISESRKKQEQRIQEQKTPVNSLLAMRNSTVQKITNPMPVVTSPSASFADERRMRTAAETVSHDAADSKAPAVPAMEATETTEQPLAVSPTTSTERPNTPAANEAVEGNLVNPEKTELSKSPQADEQEKAKPAEQDKKITQDQNVTSAQISQPENVTATSPASAAVTESPLPASNTPEPAPQKINFLKRIGSHTSLGIYYSPDLANERVSGSAANQPTHAYSWSTGMKLGYSIGSKWRISTGIAYSQFSRTETFSTIYVASDSEYVHFHHGEGHEGEHDHDDEHDDDHEGGPAHNGNHYIIHTPYGDYDLNELPEECTGEEESGETVSQVSTVESSFESFSIPLKVRFQLRSRKLGYYIEAGALYSRISGSGSKINTGIYTESSSVNGLKRNYYSALLNLGLEYRFYKGLSLFLEPNIRYSFTPLLEYGSEKAYPFFIGGNLGLAIRF